MPERADSHTGEARELFYTAMSLERHGDLRQDPAWLRTQLASDDALVLPLWKEKSLFQVASQPPSPVWLPIGQAALFLGNAREVIYLGHQADSAVFAADLDTLDDATTSRLLEHAAPGCRFIDLRRLGAALSLEQGSILAYARALARWHRNHRYCAGCGHPSESLRGGHMRRCPDCGREHFPRIDPAVIMLVELVHPEDGIPRCLLGRHAGLPGRMYSTLAGYVDPGETLEQAVAREVWEEARIRVNGVRYVASQPWPFAGSLMLGFRAHSSDPEPDVSLDELEDARWFSAAELRRFDEFSDERSDQYQFPRRDSIARLLIEQWLAEHPDTG